MIINVSSVSYVLRAFPSCLTDRNDRAKALLLCLPRSHSLMYKTKGLLQSLLVSRRGSLKEFWSQKCLLKTEGQNLPLIQKLGLAKQVITVCLGCFFFSQALLNFLEASDMEPKGTQDAVVSTQLSDYKSTLIVSAPPQSQAWAEKPCMYIKLLPVPRSVILILSHLSRQQCWWYIFHCFYPQSCLLTRLRWVKPASSIKFYWEPISWWCFSWRGR